MYGVSEIYQEEVIDLQKGSSVYMQNRRIAPRICGQKRALVAGVGSIR